LLLHYGRSEVHLSLKSFFWFGRERLRSKEHPKKSNKTKRSLNLLLLRGINLATRTTPSALVANRVGGASTISSSSSSSSSIPSSAFPSLSIKDINSINDIINNSNKNHNYNYNYNYNNQNNLDLVKEAVLRNKVIGSKLPAVETPSIDLRSPLLAHNHSSNTMMNGEIKTVNPTNSNATTQQTTSSSTLPAGVTITTVPITSSTHINNIPSSSSSHNIASLASALYSSPNTITTVPALSASGFNFNGISNPILAAAQAGSLCFVMLFVCRLLDCCVTIAAIV